MGDNKKKRDLISEQEFNRIQRKSSQPSADSPADSEVDAGSEFLAGLNYMPDEKNEYPRDESDIPVFDRKSASEVPNVDRSSPDTDEYRIPESARVIASEQPKPWKDMEAPSDTH